MELLFDALRIKPPSWSSSFLAGRRLTTYGRVSNLRSDTESRVSRTFNDANSNNRFDLTAHFSTLILAGLVEAGLAKTLSDVIEDESDLSLRRKATLLLTEVLKLAHHSLPQSVSAKLQVLPHLFRQPSTLTLTTTTFQPQQSSKSKVSTEHWLVPADIPVDKADTTWSLIYQLLYFRANKERTN